MRSRLPSVAWVIVAFVLLIAGSLVAMRSQGPLSASPGERPGEGSDPAGAQESALAPPAEEALPSVEEAPAEELTSFEPATEEAVPPELESFLSPASLEEPQKPAAGQGQMSEDQMTQAFEMLSNLLGLPDVTPDELKRRVETVGELRFRKDVPIDFMTREGLGRYIRDLFDAEYSVDFAEREERVLRAFGFLSSGQNLRTIRERVLNENIAGFYDERPNVKKLFAISSGKSLNLMNQLVLAHELRHAVQDQYFNIGDALAVKSDYDDRRVAALSLIEGDATLVMEKYMMGGTSGLESVLGNMGNLGNIGNGGDLSSMDARMAEMFAGPALREAPPIVREQLVSPYMAGRELANAIAKRGGMKLLNEKLKTPPRSMEQVLHPEKYLEGSDEPVAVSAAASGAIESEGRLGELFIRVLLASGATEATAERAAAGWGGDDFKLFREGNGTYRLSWKTAWDSDGDASEFFQSLSQLARARLGSGSFAPTLFTVKSAEGVTAAGRLTGREVVFERAGFQ